MPCANDGPGPDPCDLKAEIGTLGEVTNLECVHTAIVMNSLALEPDIDVALLVVFGTSA